MRFRATEVFWYQTGKMERDENDFNGKRFDRKIIEDQVSRKEELKTH